MKFKLDEFSDPQATAEPECSLMPDGKLLTRCIFCGKSAEGDIYGDIRPGFYSLHCQHCHRATLDAIYDLSLFPD